MDFDSKDGKSIQKPVVFENNNFLEWKNKFESYVKSIDQDLWHIISVGDFKPTKTKFENHDDYLKRKFDKNLKAKIIIYKTLPRVEYERVYFCQTANDIWKNLVNFYQEECQVVVPIISHLQLI